MKVDEKIKERLQAVVDLGIAVMDTETQDGAMRFVDLMLANRWAASAGNLLAGVFGKDSEYFERFASLTQQVYAHSVRHGHGVVLAAQTDYVAGGIFKVRHLVEAEVFVDLLAQAEHLLERTFHVAAAVLAGAVLEDALRRLCVRHGVPVEDRATMNPMNDALVKREIYSRVIWSEVAAKARVRNHAAHGETSKVTRADVDAMVPFVRRFLAECLE